MENQSTEVPEHHVEVDTDPPGVVVLSRGTSTIVCVLIIVIFSLVMLVLWTVLVVRRRKEEPEYRRRLAQKVIMNFQVNKKVTDMVGRKDEDADVDYVDYNDQRNLTRISEENFFHSSDNLYEDFGSKDPVLSRLDHNMHNSHQDYHAVENFSYSGDDEYPPQNTALNMHSHTVSNIDAPPLQIHTPAPLSASGLAKPGGQNTQQSNNVSKTSQPESNGTVMVTQLARHVSIVSEALVTQPDMESDT